MVVIQSLEMYEYSSFDLYYLYENQDNKSIFEIHPNLKFKWWYECNNIKPKHLTTDTKKVQITPNCLNRFFIKLKKGEN